MVLPIVPFESRLALAVFGGAMSPLGYDSDLGLTSSWLGMSEEDLESACAELGRKRPPPLSSGMEKEMERPWPKPKGCRVSVQSGGGSWGP